jgi:hypothetical protein
MEHGVAFVEPSGLGVDEIDQRTAGQRRGTIGDELFVEMIGGTALLGIEQRAFGGYVDCRTSGGDAELDFVFGGERGTDLDEAVEWGESFMLDLEAIEAEGEVARDEDA